MSGCIPLIQKGEALLARVLGSDSKEEQRTCGVIFAKLFIEGKLFMVAELPREVPPPPPWRPSYAEPEESRAKVITAKFDSACKDCRSEIYAGETCIWIKGQGVWHRECAPC